MKLLSISGKELDIEILAQYTNLAIYPGSFNPLHEGHRGIFTLLTENKFHVIFEISKTRFQKSPYSDEKFNKLKSQFLNYSELLVSDAPLFSQKRDQLIRFNPSWVMGYDTAERWILENKKVDADEKEKIAKMKVLFIGRLSDGKYLDPNNLITGNESFDFKIFHYKRDISSTKIREQWSAS